MSTDTSPVEGRREGADILVVDDSKSMRAFLVKTLQTAGYTCDTAEDGNQGILMGLRHPYRLILTDYDMPNVNGINLLTRLRAGSRTRTTPVIMITGRGEVEIVKQAAGLGVSGYLVKPFQAPQLLEKVRSILSPSK